MNVSATCTMMDHLSAHRTSDLPNATMFSPPSCSAVREAPRNLTSGQSGTKQGRTLTFLGHSAFWGEHLVFLAPVSDLNVDTECWENKVV